MSSTDSSTADGASSGKAEDGTTIDLPRTAPDAPGANDQPKADAVANEAAINASSRNELIRQAAHRRYVERGSAPGGEEQDWLDAEAEINQSRISD